MESYIVNAWNCFMRVVSFMKDTTILSIGGNNVTFLGLLVFCCLVNLIIWIIYELLGLFIEVSGWD